jgi:undecaprenyl-diphosphatase
MSDIEIIDPERAKHERLPSDLFRLLVALAVLVVGWLLATGFDDVAVGFAVGLVQTADVFANPMIVSAVLAVRLAALLLPLLVVAYVIRQRRYRRLALVLFAAGVAALAVSVLDLFQPALGDATTLAQLPDWLCLADGSDAELGGCVAISEFPSLGYIAGFAAGFGVMVPWISARWRAAGWITIVVFLISRTIGAPTGPAGGLAAVAFGYAIGAGTLLLFAAPDRRPRGADVVAALHQAGVELAKLEWADVSSKGSTPYFATTRDGDQLFIKVIGPEERAADAMYRSYLNARLRGVNERPFGSVRRAVEHEAGISLKARSDGAQTPRLVAVAEVGSNSMLLAYESVAGRTLDIVPDPELTDAVLRHIWEQVAVLRVRRTAHRNLGPSNLILDDHGDIWLIDFGFAELAASDVHLNTDVAELLLALAARVGAERSVATAVEVLGATAVRGCAPRLQPMAVGTSVRELMQTSGTIDAEVQEAVKQATGLEEIQFESIERVRPRTLLTVVAIGAAFYFLIPQLAELDLSDIAGADWAWFPVIVVMSVVTYVGAAWALVGSVPGRLPFLATLYAQVASSFLNRITPAKVGGMAANVRYLQKGGIETPVAVAGVGISNVAGVIVHAALFVIFVAATRSDRGLPVSLPSGQAVLVGLVVILTLAGLIMLTPRGRGVFLRGVWPIIRKAAVGIGQVGRDPMKLLLVFGGSFVTTTAYILALWYSLQAFGGGLGFVTVATVYLAGSAVAQVAPTPGGIGAAEAVLIAGLTAFGLSSAVAVPAVFLYRITTFWLPIIPGWAAFHRLQRDGAL